MGIATLRGYRMTSSHSSKDPLRPPVSGGQSVWCGHKSVVTDSSPCRGIEGVRSPPETGASTPQGGGGWIQTLRPLRPLRENINHPAIVSFSRKGRKYRGAILLFCTAQHCQHLFVSEACDGLGLVIVVAAVFAKGDVQIDVGRSEA